MNVPCSMRFLLLTTLCLTFAANGLAQTPGPACRGPELVADPTLPESFQRAAQELGQSLSQQANVDPCATVRIHSLGDAVVVEVTLVDGRATARTLSDPDMLVPTTRSLLLTMEPAPVPVAVPPPARSAESKVEVSTKARPVKSVFSDVHVEISNAPSMFYGAMWSGHSFGDALLGYGFTSAGTMELNGWLLGHWIRWNLGNHVVTGAHQDGFGKNSVSIAAALGRRFAKNSGTWDLFLMPNLILEDRGIVEPNLAKNEPPAADFGVTLRTRLHPASWQSARANQWSWFVELACELYPARIRDGIALSEQINPFARDQANGAWMGLTLAVSGSWRVH